MKRKTEDESLSVKVQMVGEKIREFFILLLKHKEEKEMQITADFSKPLRPLGKLNGTNNGFLSSFSDRTEEFREMDVDFVRKDVENPHNAVRMSLFFQRWKRYHEESLIFRPRAIRFCRKNRIDPVVVQYA